jgi:uncharacterized Fe-S cluster-containing radical SAM superfamily protein
MRLECVPDDRSGAGKLNPIIRIKDYLASPEDLPRFTPVYDVASRLLGCTWADANRVAMCDTVGCNLNCWYCYQKGRSPKEVACSVDEVVDAFVSHAADFPIWRISGGEPLLQPAGARLVNKLTKKAARSQHLVLLTTNGLIHGHLTPSPNLLIEISLKGLSDDFAAYVTGRRNLLAAQLPQVARYVDEGFLVMLNLVCLAPPDTAPADARAAASRLCKRLRNIDATLPLQTTPVVAKQYPWCPRWPDAIDFAEEWRRELVQCYGWLNAMSPAASFLRRPTRPANRYA